MVGLYPTETWRLGESIQETRLIRKHDGWVFGLPQRETHDMDGLLRELLEVLEPYRERLQNAIERFRMTPQISFGVYIRGETPACYFGADTLNRLADLQASLDVDLILSD
jgi:hypothetical protein